MGSACWKTLPRSPRLQPPEVSTPAPPPPVTATDPTTGRGVRIRFVWVGDRFGHVVERLEGESATAELTSVESDSSAAWPESPPLQQISVEQIGSATAALGVGGAGQSHWSLSVLAVEHQGRPALQFDVAVRSSGDAGYLGSTYQRTAASLRIEPLPEIAATTLTEEGARLCLIPSAASDKTTRWAYRVTSR